MRPLRFNTAGITLLLVIELLSPAVCAAPAKSPIDIQSSQTIDVEVETRGSVPGYSEQELRAYISRRMTALATAPWHFEPASPQSRYPNRVIWTFRILPDAAGTVRYLGPGSTGTIVPPSIPRKVAIDVLPIRDHVPLHSVAGEVSINGYGQSDANLDPVVSRVLERLTSDGPVVPDSRD